MAVCVDAFRVDRMPSGHDCSRSEQSRRMSALSATGAPQRPSDVVWVADPQPAVEAHRVGRGRAAHRCWRGVRRDLPRDGRSAQRVRSTGRSQLTRASSSIPAAARRADAKRHRTGRGAIHRRPAGRRELNPAVRTRLRRQARQQPSGPVRPVPPRSRRISSATGARERAGRDPPDPAHRLFDVPGRGCRHRAAPRAAHHTRPDQHHHRGRQAARSGPPSRVRNRQRLHHRRLAHTRDRPPRLLPGRRTRLSAAATDGRGRGARRCRRSRTPHGESRRASR